MIIKKFIKNLNKYKNFNHIKINKKVIIINIRKYLVF